LVRAAIFDVLAARGRALSPTLDLYAGSGALGIEALSRGSERCDFVEKDARNAAIIKENLGVTGFAEQGTVLISDVAKARDRISGPYMLVLADPPYDDSGALDVVTTFAAADLIEPNGTVVLEHSSRRESSNELARLPRIWTRRYGDTQVSMYGNVVTTDPGEEELD
jgi:16S rRNA (guanine966-N2)-methyltransferase